MLHADDRNLTLRDEVLSGLSLILDEHRMRTELDALVPAGVDHLAITSIRYKPGMSCVVGLDLVLDGAQTVGSAQLFGPAQREKFTKYRARACKPSRRGAGMCVLADAPIIVWIWPGDSEVVGLKGLHETAPRRNLVASCMGESVAADAFELHTLRYKPQRRWTARVDVQGQPQGVLKVYALDQFASAQQATCIAQSMPAINAPRVIESSMRHGAMGLAWMTGDPLDRRIASGLAQANDLRLTGQTLAELHRTSLNPSWNLPDCSITHRLDAANRAIHALAPHLQPFVNQAASYICEELLELPAQVIHGDCSADQVLINNGTLFLIDWDRMAIGPAVIDLGRFAATLTMADLIQGTENTALLMHPLIDSYRAASEIDPRPHLRAATALALLELASEPFRNRVTGWSDVLAQALRIASEHCTTPVHNA